MKQKIKLKDLTKEQFKKWYEENKNQEIIIEIELLTPKEKEYLENIIRPFKDKVISISKRSFNINLEYISIMLKEDFRVNFPNFTKNNYYKNMVVLEEYTLKDLGLFKTNYKICLGEFWHSKNRLAIHCDTEEKAYKLLKAFNKMGKKWYDGELYLNTFYNQYKEKTDG